MKEKDWKNVKELLQKILTFEANKRIEYLNNISVSVEVRSEVESLLAFESEAEDMMHLSAIDFSKDFFAGDEAKHLLIGQKIGVYQIIRELGYGGMGAVYLAERKDGKFEQKVALKLLKREMNTAALRRRFEQERKILASLEHPNIAHLLNAGTTDDKIPYIAMEYVEGLPIDDYCNKNQLNLNRRLDLFRKVCATVSFAHRNLIVHRDLKPSNILITNDGSPKLLDFGISKILSEDFEQTDSSTITKLGVMTPGYASPEQLQNQSVTTATDIYSLGIILYELLSGHRPFETKENDFQEIYKAILEIEPVLPSSIVETFAGEFRKETEAATVIQAEKLNLKQSDDSTEANKAAYTKPQIVKLNSKSLRGDLDNIVLKALRKEPLRRYSSAENFSEDIKRFLRGLPVTARPNTFSYRAEKFYKRNRASVIGGILILLAVLGGIAATLWQAQSAQTEKVKAEKRFGDVRKLANSYLFDVFPEIEDLEGSLKARQVILKTALEYLDSLSQEAEGDTDLQLELATAYEKIGEVQGAVNITNLGDLQAGLESYKKAQILRESVFAVNPQDRKNKEALSKNYQVTAQTLQWNIDTALAGDFFEKAIKLRRELVADSPDSPDFQTRLAVLLTDYSGIAINNVQNEKAGKLLDEATQILKQTTAKYPEHFYARKAYPRVLRAYSQLKSNLGDYDGAIRDIEESTTLTDELIKQKTEDYSLKRTAWLNDSLKCEIFVDQKDGQKIIENCTKTLDFNIKELEKEPDESFALFDLANSNYFIAQGYRFLNQPQRAVEFAEKALKPLAKLNKISPNINDYMREVAVIENEIADSYLMLGKTDEALKILQSAREKLEKVVKTDKTVFSYQMDLAEVYRSNARAFAKAGEKAQAVEFAGKSLQIFQKLREANTLRAINKNIPGELESEKSEYSK